MPGSADDCPSVLLDSDPVHQRRAPLPHCSWATHVLAAPTVPRPGVPKQIVAPISAKTGLRSRIRRRPGHQTSLNDQGDELGQGFAPAGAGGPLGHLEPAWHLGRPAHHRMGPQGTSVNALCLHGPGALVQTSEAESQTSARRPLYALAASWDVPPLLRDVSRRRQGCDGVHQAVAVLHQGARPGVRRRPAGGDMTLVPCVPFARKLCAHVRGIGRPFG